MVDKITSKDDANVHESPNFSDLDRGWSWVVMLASFGSFLIIGGSVYAVGIIHIALLNRYQQDISTTAWVGAVHSAMMDIGGPFTTALIDRFSCRVALVTSGCLFISGYLATVYAPTIEVCILTCGIIAGMGTAGYTAAMVVIGFNFKEKRNLAAGISVSGVGAGMFIMAPIYEAARDFYGDTGFFIALAGLSANMVVFGTLCTPSKLEKYTKEKRKSNIDEKTKGGQSVVWQTVKLYLHVAKQRSVLCLCFCMINYNFGKHLVFLHLPKYSTEMGFTPAQASFLLSLSGIMGIIGRTLAGLAANNEQIDDLLIYSGTMGMTGLATILFPVFSKFYVGQTVYAIILGLYFGCCYAVTGSVFIKLVGVEFMATAIGFQFFCGGIGSIVGPVLAGEIVDSGGTYEQSFLIAGSCMLLAGVSAAATVSVSSTTEHTIIDPDNIPGDYRLSTIQNTCVNESEITNDTAKDIIEYNGEITHL